MGFEKSIKAIILTLVLIAYASYAEETTEEKNGAFIGLQLGSSMIQAKKKTFLADRTDEYAWENSHIAYGLLSGYQHWFNNKVGMRGYAMFSGYNFYVLQFGVGVDVTYSAVKVGCGKFGIVAGLQAGGVYSYDSWYWSGSFKHNNPFALDLAVNAGMRYSGSKHTMELIVKIPFIGVHSEAYTMDISSEKHEDYLKEVYSLVWRYMYTF
ncbi:MULTISPECIES: outer membrane beta-barrel protein [Helicobacter]|uniref:Outer membrane protein beta-barrel domain-containing protein n=1 Tax=Helicobacter bilis ATCC 43879 TaxID=613026 RepID=C3XJ55_9HELI|nr:MULTISPECIES: outer membrane beta-barrel protein [Helicobacter]EEO25044.1 hypothetical protein HRAG_02101 [Helicobacter bilis ATCC 43879]